MKNNSDSSSHSHIRALVLAPTRELAIQASDSIKKYSEGTGIRSAVIYGGVDYQRQLKHIKDGLDIVIATPGRLWDHLSQKI